MTPTLDLYSTKNWSPWHILFSILQIRLGTASTWFRVNSWPLAAFDGKQKTLIMTQAHPHHQGFPDKLRMPDPTLKVKVQINLPQIRKVWKYAQTDNTPSHTNRQIDPKILFEAVLFEIQRREQDRQVLALISSSPVKYTVHVATTPTNTRVTHQMAFHRLPKLSWTVSFQLLPLGSLRHSMQVQIPLLPLPKLDRPQHLSWKLSIPVRESPGRAILLVAEVIMVYRPENVVQTSRTLQ